MNSLLSLQNIELVYHSPKSETYALKGVNFNINSKEFVSIVGPSGCGKTTILSLVAGILKPTSGKIILNSNKQNLTGYMFQRDNLFEWLTIWKNITLGLSFKNRNTEENKKYAQNLLKKYGLIEFKSHYPNELSGGMRQRVALIRTLCLRPEVLLLDEPFSALDYQTRLAVQDDVSKIIKSEGKTALLVTHDISEAIAMSDKVIILSKRPGKVKKIIDLKFDQNLSSFDRRKDKKFNKYFEEIWKELE